MGPPGQAGRFWRSRFRLLVSGLELAHGLALEFEAVCVMDQAIQNGVGEGWIADDLMPLIEGQLACDQGGGIAVAILEYLQQVVPLLGGECPGSPVVEDEEVDAGESPEQARVAPVTAAEFELGEQPGQALVEDGEVLAAGFLAQRAGEPALADAAGSSAILPGIRCLRFRFIIRFIPDLGRRSGRWGASGMPERTI